MSSYILRLWTATEPSPATVEDDPIRGVVVEVATGRSSVFVGAAQLIALLRDAAASASTSATTTTATTPASGQEEPPLA